MVRHVILWKLKEMPAAEQETVKADIKAGLEGLAGQIPGLTEIHVYTKALPSSANADLMLDTTFVDEAALKGYAVHPAHVAVADGKVRPYTAMAKAAAMVLKKGLVSSLSIRRVTKPMISPIRPAHRLSRRVPPKTGQKPAAARKLPR